MLGRDGIWLPNDLQGAQASLTKIIALLEAPGGAAA
jgi:hypothetical protein